jgi:Skp family chaperone for outer membrane proteins
MKRISIVSAVFSAGLALLALPASAQDYFIPKQNAPARPTGSPPARPTPAPAPTRQPASPMAPPDQEAQAPIQAPMPPVPELPPLPRAPSPPAAVVGIIGVPEVMHAATAAQLVDRVIGERRDKLNEEVQKEQQVWRDMQQALTNQRGSLSPDQVRAKERELQDRITTAQRSFQARSRIIQEAAQYGLNQIQAQLIAVIRQVAESRGMNLIVHRAQVALNVSDFDITDEVTAQLNKLLPTVIIPPDGVSPNAQAATPPAATPAATQPAAATTPAKKP